MNSEERILQILDQSACLSKGQLTGYLKRTLYPEELRAVELHLAGCPLCNDALEGYEKLADAASVLGAIKMPVLPAIAPKEKEKPKEKKEPVVVAKAAKPEPAPAPAPQPGNDNTAKLTSQRSTARLLRPLGIAAALVIGFGALWYFGLRDKGSQGELAQNNEPVQTTTDSNTVDNRRLAASNPTSTQQAAPVPAAPPKPHKDSLLAAHTTRHADTTIKAARLQQAPAAMAMQAENAAAPEVAAADRVSEDKLKEEATEKRMRKSEDNMAAAKAAAKSADIKEDRKKEADKPQSDFEKGLELYKQKQYASALLYFRSAESDDGNPRHWDAVYYSALCNKSLNKKRRAIKQFQRVIDAGASQKNAAQKQLNELKGKEN